MGNLYRKYRPQNFDEVVGQDAIVTILTNAISLDRVPHAFLFQGPRGTGKTSLARILAKVINCTNLSEEIKACGECTSCAKGHLDLTEIDAASNRGIADIQKLQERLHYRPRYGTKRVVIIDECQQLTTDAINSLLKIVEEPPKHVIFILCTTRSLLEKETKQQMALQTLISRLMILPFKSHSIESISRKLYMIYEAEIGHPPQTQDLKDGINLLARRAKGSLRDAENLLEVFLTAYQDSETLSSEALDWLFPPEEEKALQLLELLTEANSLVTIPLINELFELGITPSVVVQYALELLSDILSLQGGELVNRPREMLDRLEAIAEITQPRFTAHTMRCLGRIKNSDLYSSLSMAVVEIAEPWLPRSETEVTTVEEVLPVEEETELSSHRWW